MAEPFLGEIRIFSFNFAPKGWALCNGQLLSIAQNQALFAILGTTYGGNGVTIFALPNLQGRAPIHWGQGSGLSNVVLGQVAGEENHTLISTEMPSHTHTFAATTLPATKKPVNAGIFADDVDAQAVDYFATFNAPNSSYVPLNPLSMPNQGGGQPHNNMQPYLVLNICIALQGIFPSRN
ncbi:phage tail protein [Sphingomonas asaccharolytica]|uniref:phage tail protein n=1 Tax=Sphingomonas asaccharolytica TaxID=40681 RepID=UPI00082F72A2|nr:tail fiber protein [Sphingomonas asaccharolytica]